MKKLFFSFLIAFKISSAFADIETDIIQAMKKLSDTVFPHCHWSVSSGESASLEVVFGLMKRAYRDIGYPHENANEMKKYSYILTGYTLDYAIAFATFRKTQYGLRFGILGTNGSPEGKELLRELIAKLGTTRGVYAELSGAPAAIAFKSSHPQIVPFDWVGPILDKKIERFQQTEIPLDLPPFPGIRENSYKRDATIDGKPREIHKVLIGYPLI